MEHYKQDSQKTWIKKSLFFFLLIFWCILIMSCSTFTKATYQEVEKGRNQTYSTSSTTEQEIINKSTLNINKRYFSKWNVIELNSNKSFDFLKFIGNSHGWIASENGQFYRTLDGGKTWETLVLPFTLQKQNYLVDMTFVSPSSGWITSEEQRKNREESIIKIFHTEDGGQNWKLQFSSENINVSKLVFVNDQVGWAVGSKIAKKEIIYGEFFVLHTIDGGKHWIDLSEQLSKFVDIKQDNIHEVKDVFATEPNKATVVTGENLLFTTDDSGESWKPFGEIITGNRTPHFLLLPNRNFNILAGVDNKEGISTILLTRNDSNLWTKNVLARVYLKDAVYLSENQVFACGSMLPEDYKGINDSRRFGVILYSSDNGNIWTVVYQNNDVENINAINASSNKQLWAVGDKGLVLTGVTKDIF